MVKAIKAATLTAISGVAMALMGICFEFRGLAAVGAILAAIGFLTELFLVVVDS